MTVDLEACEKSIAPGAAFQPMQMIETIRILVVEVRRLQFFEVLHKTMTDLAPEMEILATNDTCAAEREQYRQERDEARRQLAENISAIKEHYVDEAKELRRQLAIAREALELYGSVLDDHGFTAREALAKIDEVNQ